MSATGETGAFRGFAPMEKAGRGQLGEKYQRLHQQKDPGDQHPDDLAPGARGHERNQRGAGLIRV